MDISCIAMYHHLLLRLSIGIASTVTTVTTITTTAITTTATQLALT